MSTWVYLDNRGCIMAANPNDMTGNTGWQEIEAEINPDSSLTDERGAALYKLAGGEVVERSEEERKADWPDDQPTEPTTVERLDEIEAAMIELAGMIGGME